MRVRIVTPDGHDFDEIEVDATNENTGFAGIERAAAACGDATADHLKKRLTGE